MKKIILIILLLFVGNVYSQNLSSIRIGGGNLFYNNDSNLFRPSQLMIFPFGIKTYSSSTFYSSGLFSSANLTVSNGVLGVTGTGYIAEGGTNINLIYGALNDTNYWKRKQTMDSLLIGSGLLLWKNGQIFSSSSLNVNSITTSSDTTADLVVTHTGKFNGSDLDWTGATHTGFNAVKISVDTITAPDEIVNIYGGLNVLAGGYEIYGRTENQNVTFTRHFPDGDLSSYVMGSTGTTISYYDSSAGITNSLKVLETGIYANDSLLASRNWVKNNVTGTDTSLLVHKSAFSQSVEATGGDLNITSADSLSLFAGTDLNIYANNGHITFFADQNITFQSTSEIVFQTSISIEGNTVTSGGTTPASVDGYVTITIDGVNRKIPFINE